MTTLLQLSIFIPCAAVSVWVVGSLFRKDNFSKDVIEANANASAEKRFASSVDNECNHLYGIINSLIDKNNK